ncbi:MAG: hypothetical protein WD028_03010 [Balneolaceae bacterium]
MELIKKVHLPAIKLAAFLLVNAILQMPYYIVLDEGFFIKIFSHLRLSSLQAGEYLLFLSLS